MQPSAPTTLTAWEILSWIYKGIWYSEDGFGKIGGRMNHFEDYYTWYFKVMLVFSILIGPQYKVCWYMHLIPPQITLLDIQEVWGSLEQPKIQAVPMATAVSLPPKSTPSRPSWCTGANRKLRGKLITELNLLKTFTWPNKAYKCTIRWYWDKPMISPTFCGNQCCLHIGGKCTSHNNQ